MDAHRHEKGSNFTTGLLLGLLLGIGITLLVVTKKGRRLLKTLTDEGLENMKDLRVKLKEAESMIDEDLYYDEMEEQSGVPVSPKSSPAPVHTASAPIVEKPHINGVKKHAKKFFRGIPKKS